MDKVRFQQACQKIIYAERTRSGIGTLGEKTLHAVLKHYFASNLSCHEIRIGSFVADIVTESGIMEIQTRSFDKLRKKLPIFLESAVVIVVFPIAKTKWLIWMDEQTGEISKKRKSPKQGKIADAFYELYKIKQYITHPNFRLCLVFLEMEEYRYLNGWSADKKRGSSRCDCIPVDIVEEIYFRHAADYLQGIPEEMAAQFTTMDYKNAARVSLRTAQITLHILHHIGVVKRVGKRGNAFIYEREKALAK